MLYIDSEGNIYFKNELDQLASESNMSFDEYLLSNNIKEHANMDESSGQYFAIGSDIPKDISLPKVSLTHPESNEAFLSATDSYFKQEERAVKYLNNFYSEFSDQFTFAEAEAGKDTIEVLLSGQKEGEGKQFNLAFSQDDNAIIFDEIKSYLDESNITDIETGTAFYGVGDIENFDERSFHKVSDGGYSLGFDVAGSNTIGLDKTELINDLRDLFPKDNTGFSFSTGVNNKELVIEAPNGEQLKGEFLSELQVKNFINENSMTEDELGVLNSDKINVANLMANDFKYIMGDVINKNLPPDEQFSIIQENSFSNAREQYSEHETKIKNAIVSELGLGEYREKYGQQFIDKIFTEVWDNLMFAEQRNTTLKTLNKLQDVINSGDSEAYTAYVDNLRTGWER